MQIKIHNHNQNDKHERNYQQSQQIICFFFMKNQEKSITDRDSGSFVDSLKSATRILVGSALAPAPVADRTFRPLRTHAARSAT